MRRRWILGMFVAGAAAVGLLAASAARLTEQAAVLALRQAGFPRAELTVEGVGLSGAQLLLRLDPESGLSLGRLSVGYSLAGLLQGRIDRLGIRGAELRLVRTEDGGLRLAGLPAGNGGGGDARLAVPVTEILVEDSRLTVETGKGTLILPMRLELAGEAGTLQGQADLTMAGAGLGAVGELLGLELAGTAAVEGSVALAIGASGVQVTPADCITVAAEGVVVAGERLALPTPLCLRAPDEAPLLDWSPGVLRVHALVEAKSLSLPGRRLSAAGLSLEIAADPAGAEPLSADLKLAALRSTEKPALFAPLAVTAQLRREAGKPLSFTARAVDGTGLLALDAGGTHDPETGRGRLDARLAPMLLKPDGPGPAQLFPRHGASFSAAGGTLSGKARLDWGGKSLGSAGSLLLEGVAATVGPASVAGVNGVLRLSSLIPPVLPEGQELAVKLLDVGLPLTDGTLRFGYGRDGRLTVSGAEWRWAGGLLRAAPFSLAPADPRGTIELQAERIDLGRMLDLVAVDGLAATGRLSGRLPVQITPDRVGLDGGTLEAVEPGTLRYDPSEPPGFLQGDEGSPTALLMGALTDFRYSELHATLDGEAGGELKLGLGILGSNPTFYDGYPVKLNLTVAGALDRILRQSLDAYRIPDAVRDRMSEFGRKDP